MPTWLSENNPSLYFLLGAVALGCAAMWWRSRQRKYAVAAGVALALLGGAIACHRLVESDLEQMVRKIDEISAATRARNLTTAFRHVDDTFRVGGVDKAGFLAFATRMQQSRTVDEFTAWDYEAGPTSRATRKGELTFRFVVRGSFGQTPPTYEAKTQWVCDAAGEWRLQAFELFNVVTDSKSPVPIPGWGR